MHFNRPHLSTEIHCWLRNPGNCRGDLPGIYIYVRLLRTRHIVPPLRPFVPNSLTGITFKFSSGVPGLFHGYHGCPSPIALVAPSLRPLALRGSMMRCEPIQYSNPVSLFGAKTSESCQCPLAHLSQAATLVMKSVSFSVVAECSNMRCYSLLFVQ
jgi:hypothetical protein